MAAQGMDFSRLSDVQFVANALEITSQQFHTYKYHKPWHLLKSSFASPQDNEMWQNPW